MLQLETHISKFMMSHIEWSPTSGHWNSRRWILHRVWLWMLGQGHLNPRNMIRDCFNLNIPDPLTSTHMA